jgi:hypothetical protein
MGTNADHQRAFRARQKTRVAELEQEVERLRLAARHDACDRLEAELRAEIAALRRKLGY